MARPLRLEVADGIYHVTARGNERRAIYRDDADRRCFLEILAASLERFRWRCLASVGPGWSYELKRDGFRTEAQRCRPSRESRSRRALDHHALLKVDAAAGDTLSALAIGLASSSALQQNVS